jgi:hypothetical protein
MSRVEEHPFNASTLALCCGLCAAAAVAQNPVELRTSPQAGLPRPWEAGVRISQYTWANFYNESAITELPLVEFGTANPLVRFTIIHKPAAATGEDTIPSPAGFSLSPGWITSYGGAVVDDGYGTVMFLEDDGNQYEFTLVSGVYVPETRRTRHAGLGRGDRSLGADSAGAVAARVRPVRPAAWGCTTRPAGTCGWSATPTAITGSRRW